MAKRTNSEQRHTKKDDDVIVSFNGKDHILEKWAKKEIAAADDDKSLNWRETFENQKPTQVINESETAPAIASYKKKKKRKINKNIKRQSGLGLSNILLSFFKSFWIPFLSAIVVGLGIGFTVLILFSDKGKSPSEHATNQQVETNQQKQSAGANTPTQDVSKLALSVQAIQGGVWSSEDAAKEGMEELKSDSNVPAAIVKDGDQYAVFVALLDSEGNRKKLESTFKENGMKYYGKRWNIKPSSFKASDSVYNFLITGKSILADLISVSGPVAVSENADQNKLEEISKTLDGLHVPGDKQLSSSLKNELNSLNGMLKTAYSKIENGEDGQQALLDALSLYQVICTNQ